MGFFKKLFKKEKKEPIEYPFHYIKIVWTESALHQGTFDDYNKEIQRIKDGEIVEVVSYTKADLDSMKKIYQIPSIDITKMKEEDFKFEVNESISGRFQEVRN